MADFKQEYIRKKFGVQLRKYRIEKQLSQEALAEKAFLDRTYISSCERGKRNIGLENIVKLAIALEIEPSVLLANQPPQENGR